MVETLLKLGLFETKVHFENIIFRAASLRQLFATAANRRSKTLRKLIEILGFGKKMSLKNRVASRHLTDCRLRNVTQK